MNTPTGRLTLEKQYPFDLLKKTILPRSQWSPYPTASNRKDWESLPEDVRKDYLEYGEVVLGESWPILPASLYWEFATVGNRSNFEQPYFQRRDRLTILVMAECCEGRGRFLSGIMDAAWGICEESSWCLPAHIGEQRAGVDLPDVAEPIVDLFAAETASLLAWTVYLLGAQLDELTPIIGRRMVREMNLRVLAPALDRDDFWWLGFSDKLVNNWNPWINSNWLACVLLIESDEERRCRAISKILRSLDRFLAIYPEDGGCDEGPSYWGRAGGSLFDCLELLYSASEGQIDVFSDPLVREIGAYIAKAHIADDYYVNFADASAIVLPNAPVVWQYGLRTRQSDLAQFGSWLAKKSLRTPGGSIRIPGRHSDFTRLLPTLFHLSSLETGPSQAPLYRDVWLPDTQVMVARDRAGSEKGWYLAVKGGHNDESHNHNDVGHFIVYRDGLPVVVDVGVEVYSRKTFSDQRYTIWTMQSAYHSLPTINGVMQSAGRQFAAKDIQYFADDRRAAFSLDLSRAYPEGAGVKRWLRRVALERGSGITLEDDFVLTAAPGTISLHLITPCEVDYSQPGKVIFLPVTLPDGRQSGEATMLYDTQGMKVILEQILIEDARLAPVWGERLFRLVLEVQSPRLQGNWVIRFE